MAVLLSDGMNLIAGNGQPFPGPGAVLWHRSAPDRLRRSRSSSNNGDGWEAWKEHLASRSRPIPLAAMAMDKRAPLAWAVAEGAGVNATSALVDSIHHLARGGRFAGGSPHEMLAAWLAEEPGVPIGPCRVLESLAWAHALPRLSEMVQPSLWWQALSHLVARASSPLVVHQDELQKMGGKSAAEQGADFPTQELVKQLLGGELPLSLSYLFPEIVPCRRLAASARRVLSAGLTGLLDGEGMLHGKHFDLLRPLLACWTRSAMLGQAMAEPVWSGAAQVQYEWLIRQALRLTRDDGTHMLSGGSSGARCDGLFEEALRLAGDDDDRDIASLTLPGGKKWQRWRVSELTLPESAFHSEWASVAVLRPDWSRGSSRLAAVHPDQSVRIELATRQGVLISGAWDFELRSDGELIRPISKWEEICWQSDDDIDYLELEIQLSGGLRMQRHMALAREDEILLLADAVLGPAAVLPVPGATGVSPVSSIEHGEDARGTLVQNDRGTAGQGARPARMHLEYRSWLPLAEGISFQAAAETREGFLAENAEKRVALVLPLALPEWQIDGRPGSLAACDRGLELHQGEQGRCLFAPLFLDLSPRRLARPFTWRQLTVAENLSILPRDVAVGYRVMVGKAQWLFYRSMGAAGNRTLLGHNLASSMLLARFTNSGEVEPMVEIE